MLRPVGLGWEPLLGWVGAWALTSCCWLVPIHVEEQDLHDCFQRSAAKSVSASRGYARLRGARSAGYCLLNRKLEFDEMQMH